MLLPERIWSDCLNPDMQLSFILSAESNHVSNSTFQLYWNVGKAIFQAVLEISFSCFFFFLPITLALSHLLSFLAYYFFLPPVFSNTLFLLSTSLLSVCLSLSPSARPPLLPSLLLCGRGGSLSCMAVREWAPNQKPQCRHKPPPSSRNPIWKPPVALTAQWRCTHILIYTHIYMRAHTQSTFEQI